VKSLREKGMTAMKFPIFAVRERRVFIIAVIGNWNPIWELDPRLSPCLKIQMGKSSVSEQRLMPRDIPKAIFHMRKVKQLRFWIV
jgi:hypothetical protein